MMTLAESETPSEPYPETIKGYCVKCNEKQVIADAEHCEPKQKTAVRGKCSVCGSKMFRLTGSKTRNRPPGYRNECDRRARAEANRKKLLDGVPTIRAAYISDQDDPKPQFGEK